MKIKHLKIFFQDPHIYKKLLTKISSHNLIENAFEFSLFHAFEQQ